MRPSDILQFMEKTYIKKILIGSIKAALKKVAVSGYGCTIRLLPRHTRRKQSQELMGWVVFSVFGINWLLITGSVSLLLFKNKVKQSEG